MYRSTKDKRFRFELLRKLGLIVLIARINRCIEIEALDHNMRMVYKAVVKGLGLTGRTSRTYVVEFDGTTGLTVDKGKHDKAGFSAKGLAPQPMGAEAAKRLERVTCHSWRTRAGTEIVHMELRNKLRSRGSLSYTSYVEKMIRKDLEFPNRVCDTIGVKIVVNKERDIPRILAELESFLGGSLSRKKEKDVYTAYRGDRKGQQNSNEYFVWKAVYDIPLPHPSIRMIRNMMHLFRHERGLYPELKKTLHTT